MTLREWLRALALCGAILAPWAGAAGAVGDPPQEPPLPQGLGGEQEEADEAEEDDAARAPRLVGSGFVETRWGVRLLEDRYQRRTSLGEVRLHAGVEARWGAATGRVSADLLYDSVAEGSRIDLETGDGPVDLREAFLFVRPSSFLDVKFGRQVQTWGTGDLIFVNDLFPKDWRALLSGRDVEYLKAPTDAIRVSTFTKFAHLDLVYVPRFDADRYVDGRRLSFFNPYLGRRSGRDAVVAAARPDDWFHDDEIAVRLYRDVGGWELAAYGYSGFWKSPSGLSSESGAATFPRLSVYGASVRGMLGPAIVYVESGYYDSRDDPDGVDPLVRNSELRLLVGAEAEIVADLTAGLQYYVERRLDHEAYLRRLPLGQAGGDRDRHVLTLRLTYRTLRQNLTLSWFSYYSPTDVDAYLLPRLTYRITDAWSADAGGNLFFGRNEHTFFGQFELNSNVFAAFRYAF